MAITDMTFLTSFTGGNRDKMKKYIGIFLQVCPAQLQVMATHLSAGDYNQLRATAHALKPQITYMGIQKGEALIKGIEHNAAEQFEVEKLPAMLTEFTTLCNEAMEELKQFN